MEEVWSEASSFHNFTRYFLILVSDSFISRLPLLLSPLPLLSRSLLLRTRRQAIAACYLALITELIHSAFRDNLLGGLLHGQGPFFTSLQSLLDACQTLVEELPALQLTFVGLRQFTGISLYKR